MTPDTASPDSLPFIADADQRLESLERRINEVQARLTKARVSHDRSKALDREYRLLTARLAALEVRYA